LSQNVFNQFSDGQAIIRDEDFLSGAHVQRALRTSHANAKKVGNSLIWILVLPAERSGEPAIQGGQSSDCTGAVGECAETREHCALSHNLRLAGGSAVGSKGCDLQLFRLCAQGGMHFRHGMALALGKHCVCDPRSFGDRQLIEYTMQSVFAVACPGSLKTPLRRPAGNNHL
jgi:hypothetical protein